MADGTPSTALRLDDQTLRALVIALGPLAECDSIGGLRGRSRDPREHPGTSGEQRDAAAALDAAHDRGALGEVRSVWERYVQLTPDAQATAHWLSQRWGAVREGALVEVAEWAIVYGRSEGPLMPRENAAKWGEVERHASDRFRTLRLLAARTRLDAQRAADLDDSRVREENARAIRQAAEETLRVWGTQRFVQCWSEWRAT